MEHGTSISRTMEKTSGCAKAFPEHLASSQEEKWPHSVWTSCSGSAECPQLPSTTQALAVEDQSSSSLTQSRQGPTTHTRRYNSNRRPCSTTLSVIRTATCTTSGQISLAISFLSTTGWHFQKNPLLGRGSCLPTSGPITKRNSAQRS